tara:strand:+ start:433 stop:690 length:258 start_codon:yes stop_codon:yes gene_type:complete
MEESSGRGFKIAIRSGLEVGNFCHFQSKPTVEDPRSSRSERGCADDLKAFQVSSVFPARLGTEDIMLWYLIHHERKEYQQPPHRR